MKKIFCALALLIPTSLSASVDACLISPVTPHTTQMITNIYGCRSHPVTHKWLPHNGVDFRARMGTPLVAARNGEIQRLFSSTGGQEVRIVGGPDPMLRYLHLSRASVEPGSYVTIGKEIGRSGSSGRVTAEHLHFEVIKNISSRSSRGKRKSSINVDPEPLLCKKIEHKLGAEVSDGLPIRPPINGVCSSKLSTQSASFSSLAFIASSRASHLFTMLTLPFLPLASLALPATDTVHTATSIAPTVEQFDDVSTVEILSSEVLKRFANPPWHAEQAERSIVPLLNEYVQMKALEDFLNLHKQRIQERIETLLAIRLARQHRGHIEELLLQQRKSAAHAANH